MNILFLSELFYPHGGGAEFATWLYAKLLERAGFDVAIITNRFEGEPELSKNENLTIYRLNLFRGKYVKYSIYKRIDVLLSSFFKRIVRWTDIVYIPRYWFSSIPFVKAYGKPVVTHFHDYIAVCPLSNAYNISKDAICGHNGLFCSPKCICSYERAGNSALFETLMSTALNSSIGPHLARFVRLSDAIVCVSEAQGNVIARANPLLQAKIHVVDNPLPELSYLDLGGNDFGYFGGRNFMKGFTVLCQALAHLGDQSVRVHATNFPSLTEKSVGSLKRLGILPCRRLSYNLCEGLYRHVRAIVVPSIIPETWSYVVSEAILRGRIVVASKVGEIPRQLEGCQGFLFSPGDYFDLANQMRAVKDLTMESVGEITVRNREIYLEKHNNENTFGKFVDVLESAIP
jgi:glycosyltransferase involved in cell wall biosynthesis